MGSGGRRWKKSSTSIEPVRGSPHSGAQDRRLPCRPIRPRRPHFVGYSRLCGELQHAFSLRVAGDGSGRRHSDLRFRCAPRICEARRSATLALQRRIGYGFPIPGGRDKKSSCGAQVAEPVLPPKALHGPRSFADLVSRGAAPGRDSRCWARDRRRAPTSTGPQAHRAARSCCRPCSSAGWAAFQSEPSPENTDSRRIARPRRGFQGQAVSSLHPSSADRPRRRLGPLNRWSPKYGRSRGSRNTQAEWSAPVRTATDNTR